MNGFWIKFLPKTIRLKLEEKYSLKKILDNVGWLFFDRIFRMGVGIFVGLQFARYLGPEQFGLYNYVIAFVALFSPFVTLGLEKIIIREIVQEPNRKHEILGTAFILRLIASVLTCLFIFLIINLLSSYENSNKWLVIITAIGFLFQSFDIIDFWFQSQVKIQYSVFAKDISCFISSLIKIYFIQLKSPLMFFIWAGVFDIFLNGLCLILAYILTREHIVKWRFNWIIGKRMLLSSYYLIFSSIAIIIYLKIDQLMLEFMLDNKAVGIYSAAVKLSEIWYFIPSAIVASTFPMIIRCKEINETTYYSQIKKLLNLMIKVAYSIAIPTSLLSRWIIHLLYGDKFMDSASILAVHIWSGVFVFLSSVQEAWYIIEGLTHISFIRALFGAALNIILNIFFIPKYSGLGAAIATIISYAFTSVLMNIMNKQTRTILILQLKALSLI